MLVYINGSTLESRMDRLESKIDRIIEYLEEPPTKTRPRLKPQVSH